MGSARLRKVFRYPTESGNEPAEGIDEEEQETLISLLKRHDAESTAFFVRIFLAFPLLAAVTYIPSIIYPASGHDLVISVLGLFSLASTAYMLHISSNQHKSAIEPHSSRIISHQTLKLTRRFVISTNIISCLMLAFEVWQKYQYNDIAEPKLWSAIIPSIVFVMSFLACNQLRPIDLSALERMKYGYKGA